MRELTMDEEGRMIILVCFFANSKWEIEWILAKERAVR